MVKRTGPMNVQLQALIQLLKKQGSEQNADIWKRIAFDLEMPSRRRRVINVFKLGKCTKSGENVIVPGKVLGTGVINHGINVAAFAFSDGAKKKITLAKGQCMTIEGMISKNPKGENLRIMG